jgi:hypothetical protein
MAKDTARKWKHRRVIVVAANKCADANAWCAAFRWGPGFFSIPLYNKTGHNIQNYAADVVLTDAMLVLLNTIPTSVLKKSDIETPTTKAKGDAKLKEIAAKRNVDLKVKV